MSSPEFSGVAPSLDGSATVPNVEGEAAWRRQTALARAMLAAVVSAGEGPHPLVASASNVYRVGGDHRAAVAARSAATTDSVPSRPGSNS